MYSNNSDKNSFIIREKRSAFSNNRIVLNKFKMMKFFRCFVGICFITSFITGCANGDTTTRENTQKETTTVLSTSSNESSKDNDSFNKKIESVGPYKYYALTKDEMAPEKYWSKLELGKDGTFYYPGFQLGLVKFIDSKYFASPSWYNETDGIEVFELSPEEILIKSDKKYVVETYSSFRDIPNGSSLALGERLFLSDLTGDGKKELILKYTILEDGPLNNFSIYSTDTLEKISYTKTIESIRKLSCNVKDKNTLLVSLGFDNGSEIKENFAVKTAPTSSDINIQLSTQKIYYAISNESISVIQKIEINNLELIDDIYLSSKLTYNATKHQFVESGEYKFLANPQIDKLMIVDSKSYEKLNNTTETPLQK